MILAFFNKSKCCLSRTFNLYVDTPISFIGSSMAFIIAFILPCGSFIVIENEVPPIKEDIRDQSDHPGETGKPLDANYLLTSFQSEERDLIRAHQVNVPSVKMAWIILFCSALGAVMCTLNSLLW
jgi:hypothetical protein